MIFLSSPILLSPLVFFESISDLTNSLEPGRRLIALQIVVDQNPTENKSFWSEISDSPGFVILYVCNIILVKSDPDP
jgi:hypothetical protein